MVLNTLMNGNLIDAPELNNNFSWLLEHLGGDSSVSSDVTYSVDGSVTTNLVVGNNITVNASKTVTCTPTLGGVTIFIAKNTITINGTISATGQGRAGTAAVSKTAGTNAGGVAATECWLIAGGRGGATIDNGNAGGATPVRGVFMYNAGTSGTGLIDTEFINYLKIKPPLSIVDLIISRIYATTTEVKMCSGAGTSGGSEAGGGGSTSVSGAGGASGGTIILIAKNITFGASGAITSSGAAGGNGSGSNIYCGAGGGGGSGGFIMLYAANTLTYSTGTITALGGAGGNGAAGGGWTGYSGNGGNGGLVIDYYQTKSGTVTPTLTLGAAGAAGAGVTIGSVGVVGNYISIPYNS